ncbi:MAG: LD-carboxypeptidase [Bacteroidetes bacterium]|nr:MAG: LD-carboxypeptidase [Bacteroidota bacterium]
MIDRRSFIRKSGAAAALSVGTAAGLRAGIPGVEGASYPVSKPRILPRALKKGDLIGLVTPGSPITGEQLEEAVEKLENLGFRTYYKESVLSEYGYLAGRDQERADELMHMFTNEEVKGIWCVRGGYGSIRILSRLDYEKIEQNPKVFIGYSDITALLTTIYEQTGMVTYHGPVGTSEFNKFTVKSLEEVIMDPGQKYRYPYKRDKDTVDNPEYDRYTIHGGEAEGLLIGGNISVLDSMIGSNFEPNFENKIVYLEEIEEKTYRLDKMLFHLLEATNLKLAAGIAMGVMGGCNINDEPRLTLKQAIRDLMEPLDMPASYGLSFGHIEKIITIPNGIRARLNADRNFLKLLEKTVEVW